MKFKSLLAAFFIASTAVAANPFADISNPALDSYDISQNIVRTDSWTEYTTFGGVKIEYKFQDCNSEKVKNQTLVLFKYTNETGKKLKLSWQLEVYRDGECYNCHRMDNPEYGHEIVLNPHETIAGDGTSFENDELYLFANFIKLSPGMSDQQLTNFKFINLHTEVVK